MADDPNPIRAAAIDAAASAACEALQLLQALRTIDGANVCTALAPTLHAAGLKLAECGRQVDIIAETLP